MTPNKGPNNNTCKYPLLHLSRGCCGSPCQPGPRARTGWTIILCICPSAQHNTEAKATLTAFVQQLTSKWLLSTE